MTWTAGAATGYCEHGKSPCQGSPERQLAACHASEHRFCAHGVDARATTKDGEIRCSYCRGVTRRFRNADTWRPARTIAQPAPEPER